ncbi:MAG: SDR family oxidoreductase [Chloracidobacterium sp.]|uniref:SDR family oxidoreductase n=1 Tax=Chloracidobacterium validum TaxID=2821543 RepID=A0ABX8B796_9BACT|nr:SDR family oxidoreductase [Chloracidobacterium validum]QUW02831.1 SDR family oxidoreductase [Chloracidobacterium validum]
MSATYAIFGATSGIARAVMTELAKDGAKLILAGRNLSEVERIASDVRLRHRVTTHSVAFDACDFTSHASVFAAVVEQAGDLDGILVAFGTLTDQKQAEQDPSAAEAMIVSNYTGVVSLVTHAANYFEARRKGVICVIASVAGDRGRQSNYVYGSAKAGVAAFCQGLRQRLSKKGVRVVTIKPGMVETPMTYGLKLPPIVVKPERVARDIARAIQRADGDIYTPFFWRFIMLIIRMIPEPVFKRLSL